MAPDITSAADFLLLLDETADAFTFQTFDDNKDRGDRRLARVFNGPLHECAPALAALNEKGAGIFVTVNATDGKGRKLGNITRIRALWQEDDGDGKPLPIEPHIAVESSPGKYHRYLLVDGLSVDDFRAAQQRLVATYASDPSAADPARVLRLPGFYHRKVNTAKGQTGTPHLVRIVETSSALPYSVELIRKALPPIAQRADAGERDRGEKLSALRVAELRSALASMCSDDRELWIRVAHALKHYAQGYGLWVEWSQKSAKFEPRAAQAAWDSVAGDNALSYRSIFQWAQADGWVNPKSRKSEPEPDLGPTGGLRQVDLSDLATAEIDPPQFVIEPIVPRGHTTLLAGHGGSGKTILALTLSAHAACGRDFGPLRIERARVLFVSLEDPAQLLRYRLRRICEEFALPIDEVCKNLEILDGTDTAGLAVEQAAGGVRSLIFTAAIEHIRDRAAACDLVTIDNASDAFDANENERRLVRAFIRYLTSAVKAHNGAVLLLAHIDKAAARYGASSNSYSGSTAWHNSTRSRIALVDEKLAHEKLNVGKKLQEPLSLYWSLQGVLVPDTDKAKEQEDRAAKDEADDSAVLDCIRAAKVAGELVPAASRGTATAWHCLRQFAECPEHLQSKDGQQRIQKAIIRLARAGVIRRGNYKDQHRHNRENWVLDD